ncbi:MAG: 5'-methylthioadenosine/S-adenosylhomocysteine nucleosidase, partial [Nitratireductor sp.]
YRDMDVSALGYEKGVTPFLDIQASIALDITIEGIESASLSSGAGIVSGKAYDDIDAQMVDMETFAIKRCCMQHDIPMIGLRGISDGKEELKVLTDWTQYLELIDEKLAQAVDQLEQAVLNNSIVIITKN